MAPFVAPGIANYLSALRAELQFITLESQCSCSDIGLAVIPGGRRSPLHTVLLYPSHTGRFFVGKLKSLIGRQSLCSVDSSCLFSFII